MNNNTSTSSNAVSSSTFIPATRVIITKTFNSLNVATIVDNIIYIASINLAFTNATIPRIS